MPTGGPERKPCPPILENFGSGFRWFQGLHLALVGVMDDGSLILPVLTTKPLHDELTKDKCRMMIYVGRKNK